MWQYVFYRASMMFAQAATGVPAGAPGTAPEASVTNVNTSSGTVFKHTILHTIFLMVYFIVCVGLVIAVLLQTTKNEGLSGAIGGASKAVFKGKKGFEEVLQEYTNYLAVGFIALSLIMSFFLFKS